MIRCHVVRNAFRPWDREGWIESHRPGSVISDYVPGEFAEKEGLVAFRNSALAQMSDTVGPDDSLAFMLRPMGFSSFIVPALISVAASFVLSKIFPPPRLDGPQQRDSDASPTYSFKGISNNRTEGQPIPIVYGEMRVGGSVIGEYVTAVSLFPIQTDLHMLVCFGEGPIHSVGGIETDTPQGAPLGEAGGADLPTGIKVNDNLAENYAGIEAQVRLGTQEQEVIPAFEDTRQTYDVDQKLTSTETTTVVSNSYSISRGNGAEYDSTNDDFWTDHAVAFDLNVEDADEFIARIRFPNGYFRQDLNTGGLLPAWFGMQARYRELDSGGVPITTGGPNSDGWVRLPIVDLMPFSKRGAFEWEYRQPFIDKDDYADPVVGKGAYLGGGSGRIGAQADQFPYAGGDAVDALTLSFWVKFESSTFDTPAAGTWFHVAGDYHDSSKRGWSIGAQRRVFSNYGNPVTKWQWAIEWGDGTNRHVAQPPIAHVSTHEPKADTWYHVVVTYEKELGGTGQNCQWRFYLNSQRIIDDDFLHGSRLRAPSTAQNHLRFGNNPQGTQSSRFEEMLLDDLHMYSVRVGTARVSQLWNGGRGTSAIIRPDECVANFNWDHSVTGLVNNAAPTQGGPWYADATIENGGPTVGSEDGRVATNSSGTFKKGQYRVEVIRVNDESTAASVTNEARFDVISSIIDVALSYPNVALCGLRIPATDQLNTSTPNCTFMVKGRLVPVWDGLSETNPAITPTWSANPAWIALDIVTHKRYGLGQFYDVSDVVLTDLLGWANYCEATVYDGGLQQVLTGDGFDDVWFDPTVTDADTGETRGSIEFYINPANLPGGAVGVDSQIPNDWTVGGRIYITGFPDTTHSSGNILNDIDSEAAPTDFAGYEIYSIERATTGAQQWIIKCYWDRTSEADPWAGPYPSKMSTEISPDDFGDFTATVSGGQPRFQFNGVFDSNRSAWDALLEVCSVGRAIPIREGQRLRFKYNAPRDPVGVIGLGSIIEDSFEISYGGLEHKPNLVEATFLDRSREYETTTIESRADELNPTTTTGVRKVTRQLFGVTDRHQAQRQARFEVLANEKLVREAKWQMGANGLQYEPGDVVRIAHDIIKARGVSGRVWSNSSAQDRFKIDRDLTILAATTYKVYIHNLADVTAAGEIDTAVTVPGSYSPGDEIRLTANLGLSPRQDDVFIIVIDGQELLMEITNVERKPDLSMELEAVEYDATIYADENSFTTESQTAKSGNPLDDPGNGAGGPTTEHTLPQPVRTLRLSDRFTKLGPGAYQLALHATWRVEEQDRPYIARTEVWARSRDDESSDQVIGNVGTGIGAVATEDLGRVSTPWRQVAVVAGADEFAEVPLPQALVGAEIDVAICPVKFSGARRAVPECQWSTHHVGGIGPQPEAGTDLESELRGQKAVITWEYPIGHEDCAIEVRRSSNFAPVKTGWILAPIVWRGPAEDRATPPLRDWAGSTGIAKTRLYARLVSPLGAKSDIFRKTFNPAPDLDSFPPAIEDDDNSWSTDTVNGWVKSVPAPGDATLSNLQQVTGSDGLKYLSFSGSSTSGTWTGPEDSSGLYGIDQFRVPRDYYVEAVMVVEQVHPQVLDGETELGDPAFARFTLEGPTHLRRGESQCSVRIQARFNIDGTSTGWGEWQDFRPGRYTFVVVQWRLKVTRPDDSFDVRLHYLETRITSPRQGIESRPPYTAALSKEFFA